MPQGTPWSEELDGKELHGALGGEYDLEPSGSVFFFCTPSVVGANTALVSFYKLNVALCSFYRGRGVFA